MALLPRLDAVIILQCFFQGKKEAFPLNVREKTSERFLVRK
jgi:hypothetical protein